MGSSDGLTRFLQLTLNEQKERSKVAGEAKRRQSGELAGAVLKKTNCYFIIFFCFAYISLKPLIARGEVLRAKGREKRSGEDSETKEFSFLVENLELCNYHP